MWSIFFVAPFFKLPQPSFPRTCDPKLAWRLMFKVHIHFRKFSTERKIFHAILELEFQSAVDKIYQPLIEIYQPLIFFINGMLFDNHLLTVYVAEIFWLFLKSI